MAERKGEPMDLIERQKAIDALADMHCKSDEDGYVWIIRSDAWARIDALPSTQPEPCEDAVSRKMAMDAITASTPYCVVPDDYHISVVDMEFRISTLPSVTPKQKCGKWNAYYHGINETPSFTYSCNQCGYSAPYGLYGGKYSQKEWNFCPNCGARMTEEDV